MSASPNNLLIVLSELSWMLSVMFTNSLGFSHKEVPRMMCHVISVKAFEVPGGKCFPY